MSETDETAVAEEVPGAEAPEAAGAPADDDVVVTEDGTEVSVEDAGEAPAAVVDAEDTTTGRQAKVYLCERGHRTMTLWSTPTTCRASISRRDECGRQLYPIGELPDQVQKALNPLKASKKASKKG